MLTRLVCEVCDIMDFVGAAGLLEKIKMSFRFTLYERAGVHPRYKTFQDMIFGGSTLPFYSATYCIFSILYNFNLALLKTIKLTVFFL